MNLFKLLGLQRKRKPDIPQPSKEVLHLWEDDYLMIELLPVENLEFVKSETKRINAFGEENFNGVGFTDITPIAEKPVKTLEKSIDFSEIERLLLAAGLGQLTKFHMQDVGYIECSQTLLGFGTNSFAVMCDAQKELLKNIWLTGQTRTEEDKEKLTAALLSVGQTFNFIAVNWYQGEYYNLIERPIVTDFIEKSC